MQPSLWDVVTQGCFKDIAALFIHDRVGKSSLMDGGWALASALVATASSNANAYRN